MKAKYNLDDLKLIGEKKASVKDIAEKYGVSVKAVYDAINLHRVRVYKKPIIIEHQYGRKVVYGIPECADELGVSTTTIHRALKGERIKVLSDMEIIVHYAEERK